ncbi:flagellar biosynthesis anti-sigma factor FlgM [Neopusillimonas aromaticivorans]|uniref:flagellar biosynthesis anti-sigma factor FlgM n=1 Tax=Neopusillimonas aromaticivorans TaxID=2979868 RepID=UPI0025957890|nr:flagellar biosynthesis anti-sigma factor FlgM [Neopusillimonas aromaticivorans]NLZ12123.1 flagellar biosynthesis anti-sigma factor FlgM [Alcaligenaceae bacterium]WJJ93180.1 flagellar biosynthesis anti-sigma factor FlgM [Neopusillimonas aromaticivorans]
MKITPSLNKPVVSPVAPVRQGGNVASASSGASGKSPVDLSSTARHLSSLENGDNDIDMAKVQQIRDAIAAGQLKVNPERIADSLLSSARELLK